MPRAKGSWESSQSVQNLKCQMCERVAAHLRARSRFHHSWGHGHENSDPLTPNPVLPAAQSFQMCGWLLTMHEVRLQGSSTFPRDKLGSHLLDSCFAGPRTERGLRTFPPMTTASLYIRGVYLGGESLNCFNQVMELTDQHRVTWITVK